VRSLSYLLRCQKGLPAREPLSLRKNGTGVLRPLPAALSYPMNMARYDWGFTTQPEPGLGGRVLACPRGRVIGGSSSINGMVYVRGNAGDYDYWAAKHTDDYNGEKQEGFGPMEQTVWRGRRWSTANAYLRPALKRQNVSMRHGFVRRVLFEGKKAVGVEFEKQGQDHLELYFQVECKQPITLYSKLNLFSKAMIGARWLFLKSGLGASNHFESAAFIRSAAGVDYPDIQYHFLPVAIRYDGKSAASGHGFQMHVGPMRSDSRGSVTLSSADPAEPPEILFNYMSTEKDWRDFRQCMRLTRELLQQDAFKPFAGDEIAPGAGNQTDAELDAFIREHCESAYHPCGTCRMGEATDPMAVVDNQCSVIGVEGLRVVDCSVFPRITNGNLNAPTIVTAEKASDAILGKPSLSPVTQTPWRSERWQTSQR